MVATENKQEEKKMDKYFYGNKVSEYGVKNGRVDYRCLAKAFDAVLANGIIEKTSEIGNWELESGSDCYYEDSEGNIYHSWDEMNDKRDEIESEIKSLKDSKPEEPEYEGNEEEYDKWEQKCNEIDDRISELESELNTLEYEHYEEIFQYYIISDNGAEILKRETHEIVYYNEELDLYVWGVTHWGTGWDYVLTEIEI